jgi:superfamily II DNA or RNA helicase
MEKFFLCEVIVVPPGYGKTIVILYLAMLIVENYNMRVAIVVTSEL